MNTGKFKANAKVLLLIAGATFIGNVAWADETDVASDRFDRRGDRIEERLDERGDRINDRLDRASDRAADAGRKHRSDRLDRKGDRIDRRLDRRGG